MPMIFLYFFLLQIATSAVFCTYIVHKCSMQEYLSLHISIMPSRAAVQRIHLFSVFSLHAFYICECVPLGTRIEPTTPDKRPADLPPPSHIFIFDIYTILQLRESSPQLAYYMVLLHYKALPALQLHR